MVVVNNGIDEVQATYHVSLEFGILSNTIFNSGLNRTIFTLRNLLSTSHITPYREVNKTIYTPYSIPTEPTLQNRSVWANNWPSHYPAHLVLPHIPGYHEFGKI